MGRNKFFFAVIYLGNGFYPSDSGVRGWGRPGKLGAEGGKVKQKSDKTRRIEGYAGHPMCVFALKIGLKGQKTKDG